MPTIATLLAFALISLGMVLTPGPNMLAARPGWLLMQRWLMGTVVAGLAVRMTTEARRG